MAGTRTRPDLWLLGLCASRASLTLILMTYAASLPVLRTAWGMSATAAGSVSTSFQLGHALSLLAFSWLADRIGARRIYLLSASLSGATALAFALFARSYLSALVLYTLVALSQGGTYTTAIMLIADRYPPQRRGSAMGWLLGGMSLSHAASLLIVGAVLPMGGYPMAFLVTAGGTVLGMLLAWSVLWATPNVIHPRPAGQRFGAEVMRNPQAVRLMAGYTAHTWELLGMWAWTPSFLAASLVLSGSVALRAAQGGAYLAAVFHLLGMTASLTMGRLSDHLGRRTVLLGMAATSAACSLSFGWLVAWPASAVALVGALYGFAALGDSPVLSVAFTEAVRPAYLGSALALRALLGFGAGAASPLAFGAILDATNPPGALATTWGWSYVALGVGGVIAALCAYGLARQRP